MSRFDSSARLAASDGSPVSGAVRRSDAPRARLARLATRLVRERVSGWGRRALRVAATEVKMPVRAGIAGLVSELLPQFAFPRVRTATLRVTGLSVGERSTVMGGLHVTGVGGLDLIRIGDDSIITGPIHIDVGAPVQIGDRVHIGHHVVLLTVNHRVGPPEERCGPLTAAPITIGDGVWIASCVTILPGVSLGRGSVVGAGAVVTRDVEPNTMVAGVPAVPVRRLSGASP